MHLAINLTKLNIMNYLIFLSYYQLVRVYNYYYIYIYVWKQNYFTTLC